MKRRDDFDTPGGRPLPPGAPRERMLEARPMGGALPPRFDAMSDTPTWLQKPTAPPSRGPNQFSTPTLANFYSILNNPNLWSGMHAAVNQRRQQYSQPSWMGGALGQAIGGGGLGGGGMGGLGGVLGGFGQGAPQRSLMPMPQGGGPRTLSSLFAANPGWGFGSY